MSRTSTYKVWEGMVGRGTNPNDKRWSDYGGRGIAPCQQLGMTFVGFLAVLGERPPDPPEWKGKVAYWSIDRIDFNGGYWCGACDDCVAHGHPLNVRWADPVTQAQNQRKAER
jgi:hypothetical protein